MTGETGITAGMPQATWTGWIAPFIIISALIAGMIIAFYFIIKRAVRKGNIEAHNIIAEKERAEKNGG